MKREGRETKEKNDNTTNSFVGSLGSTWLPHNDSVYFGASLMRTVAGDKKYINGSVYFHALAVKMTQAGGERLVTSECQLSAMFMSVISERFPE